MFLPKEGDVKVGFRILDKIQFSEWWSNLEIWIELEFISNTEDDI